MFPCHREPFYRASNSRRPGATNPANRDRTLCYAPKNMDLTKALAELHEERDRIDEAILKFSRLAAGAPKRRGRPPKWMAELTSKRRGRPPGRKGMSKAARKAQSERMKKYWAQKRKAKA